MSTQAIIMAQGGQTRLPSLAGKPKQLLQLEKYGASIIERTIRMLIARDVDVAVIGPAAMVGLARVDRGRVVTVGTLENPGNTVIKGLAQIPLTISNPTFQRTLILLGDVVYSRAMMDLLVGCYSPPLEAPIVAGTPNLTSATGEVFGISFRFGWANQINEFVRTTKAPPFTEYQPGQLRKLLWQLQCQDPDRAIRSLGASGIPSKKYFRSIEGDWTKDIDTEKEMRTLLPVLDQKAWEEARQI